MNISLRPTYVSLIASGSVHLGLIVLLAMVSSAPRETRSFVEITLMPSPVAKTSGIESTITSTPSPITKNSTAPKTAKAAPLISKPAIKTDNQSMPTNAVERGGAETLSADDPFVLEVARLLNARKSYPEAARRLRQQGRVKIRFEIDRQGRILSYEIIEKSPYEILNDAAGKFIRDINGLIPIPTRSARLTWSFIVPIEYKL